MKQKNLFTPSIIRGLLILSVFALFFFSAPIIFAVSDLAQLPQPDVIAKAQTQNMASMLNLLSNADVLAKLSVSNQKEIYISPQKSSYQSFLDFGTAILATIGSHLISGGNIISDFYHKTDIAFAQLGSKIFLPKVNVPNVARTFYNNYTSLLADVLFTSSAVTPKITQPQENNNSTPLLATAVEAQTEFPELISTDSNGNPQLSYYTYNPYNPYVVETVKEMNLKIEAISGEIVPIPGSQSDSFVTAFFKNIKTKLVTWLGDATNGIGDLFAGTITVKNELCINNTCINQSQLQNLLQIAEHSQQATPLDAASAVVAPSASTTN